MCNFLSTNSPHEGDDIKYRFVDVSEGRPPKPKRTIRKTEKGVLGDGKRSLTCITNSKLPLKQHQINVVKALEKHRGVLAVHTVGTGKTLTAVTASQCFLSKNPKYKVVVITPTSLQTNFKKEMKNYGADPDDSRYEFYTLQGFTIASKRGETNCKNKMIIIDEAHNLRTAPKIQMQKQVGIMAMHAIQCTKNASKVLLLTATPVVNRPEDMITLLAMINGTDPMSEKDFNSMIIKDDLLQKEIDCSINFYEKEKDENYPERIDYLIPIEMTEEYYEKYKKVESMNLDREMFDIFKTKYNTETDLTKFYNGVRRASNNIELENSPKVNWIMNRINKTAKTYKFVIFSHFIDAGSKLLIKRLKNDGISYGYIDGTMSIKERSEAVRKYNENKIKVLIISKAGGEGLDLKGTRDIILMEPSWNETVVEQVIGRGIRFKSHTHLPEEKRKVRVIRLLMISPDEYKIKSKLLSQPPEKVFDWAVNRSIPLTVDLYLYKLSERKQKSINLFLERVKKLSKDCE